MVVCYLLTARDFRTDDNRVLYRAYEAANRRKEPLYPIFRFDTRQIDPAKNPYYSQRAVLFMAEALELLRAEMNISVYSNDSDDDLGKLLVSRKVDLLFISQDVTPFARQRVATLKKYVKVQEVADTIQTTSFEKLPKRNKLGPFIQAYPDFPKPEKKRVDWKKATALLSGSISTLGRFRPSHIEMEVRPRDLKRVLSTAEQHIKGYGDEVRRKLLNKPAVTHLSAFLKFGMVSPRHIYHLGASVNSSDRSAFRRELLFRDFFYALAYHYPERVYETPNRQRHGGKTTDPGFCLVQDFKNWYRRKPTEKETAILKKNQGVLEKWRKGKTEYELINAGIRQLIKTGYMLNRLRMMTTSYVSRDSNLWWKYAEEFFAQQLTDYDWTINALNHMNIAKVGPYPKYTQDFKISTQEKQHQQDKQEFIKRY